jgi:hypothetical protein
MMLLSTVCCAEDFRLDSKVYSGGGEPKAINTTIFCDGMIFDYLEKPAEITVLDKNQQKFILLDPERRIKAELSLTDVATLNANLKRWAATQSAPYLRFLGDPKFEQHVDDDAKQVTFESKWITYRVLTTPASKPEIAKQFRDFSDWYTQLNTRLNPGYKLAFARMVVNEALEKRNELPREVFLSVAPHSKSSRSNARSQHHVTSPLTQADRDRIAQTDQFIAIFTTVRIEEYQKRTQPDAADAKSVPAK